jgi:hypothetical protein
LRRRLGRWRDVLGAAELKEVSLPRGIDQTLSPRAKDVPAEQLNLPAQVIDGLFVVLDDLLVRFDRLIVKLRGLFERGLEVLNLLSEALQQAMTFARISRP